MVIEFLYKDNELYRIDYLDDNYNYLKSEYYKTTKCKFHKYKEIHFFENNLVHRLNKPAYKLFDINGITYYESYYYKGYKHNSVGPAEIYSGNQKFEVFFFLYGNSIDKNRFLELLESKLNDN